MVSRKASRIKLSADERAVLDRRVRRRKIARADAQRSEIILRAADGLNNCEIADAAGVTRQTVRTWRERFAKHRLDGLDDEPRCGAPRKIGDNRIEEIVTKTLETKPADATHWSTRGMAKAAGVSASSVHRIFEVAYSGLGYVRARPPALRSEAPPIGAAETTDTLLPLLDLSDAAVKRLIRIAKKRGYVTHDQVKSLSEELKDSAIRRHRRDSWNKTTRTRKCASSRSSCGTVTLIGDLQTI